MRYTTSEFTEHEMLMTTDHIIFSLQNTVGFLSVTSFLLLGIDVACGERASCNLTNHIKVIKLCSIVHISSPLLLSLI